MGPETAKLFAGMIQGQRAAMVILIDLLHRKGVIDAADYTQAIRDTFNDPAAKTDMDCYTYLQKLANIIEDQRPAGGGNRNG